MPTSHTLEKILYPSSLASPLLSPLIFSLGWSTHRHRLISTANLHREEGGLVPVAGRVAALNLLLLRVVPCARTAEDVLLLLAREVASAEDRLLDRVLVRTGPAFEAVAARLHRRDGEDVGAVRADWGERGLAWGLVTGRRW
jgi:hypothetical protein